MRKRNKFGITTGVLCLFLIAVCIGCVDQRTAVSQSGERVQPGTASSGEIAKASEPAEENIYDVDVKPLTSQDCARCHTSHFSRIKQDGGRHRSVACTDCHEIFHAYNPLKDNYAKIMPKCSACHDDPHGKDKAVQQCADCHADPHRPVVAIPDPSNIEMQCRACHTKVAQSLVKYLSKHTDEDCSSCHSESHGRIPGCAECHESHSPAVTMDTPQCLVCHPVHTPLQIAYSDGVENNLICAGCHDQAFNQLRDHQTLHSALACAECHPTHKELMACQDCHGDAPHNPAIHKKYPVCGACHSIAHDLRM